MEVFGGSSDGLRRGKGDDKANAFQLEELSRALRSMAALTTQRGSTGFQLGSVMRAPELHGSDICKASGLEVEAVHSEAESLAFSPEADEDGMERSGLPVMWEVSRNAGGVRHLEWEGADKACGTAREEREAAWEASLPCQGQGNCGGLHFLAWRWDCDPQSFLPAPGQKKFLFKFFFAETHILV